MSRKVSRHSLWDNALSWMEKNHGKSIKKDKKGTLNIFLHHLDVLIDEVVSVLEENFVALDIDSIEKAGIEPLLIPTKLFPLFGSSYILHSEANEDLKSVLSSSVVKEEANDYSDEEEDMNDYSDEEIFDDTDPIDEDPSYLDEGAYTCCKCSSVYDTYDELVDHLQTTCFEKVKTSKKRKRSKGTIEDRTCKICSRTFSTVKYLKYRHSLKCVSNPNDPLKNSFLKCSNCDRVYKTVPFYYLHIKART